MNITVESDPNKKSIVVKSNIVMINCIEPRTDEIAICIEFCGQDVPTNVTFTAGGEQLSRLLKDTNKKMEDRNFYLYTSKDINKHSFRIIPNVDVWLDTNKAQIFLAALDTLSLELAK